MNIKYPHASIIFKIEVDDNNLYHYLKTYFGTAVLDDNSLADNNLEIYYIKVFYHDDQMEIIYKSSYKKFYVEKINVIHVIFMIIRDNLSFEENWTAYHGSVVNLDGRNYLFMGESGAGKTTMVTYLLNICSARIFTEDIVIINYLKNEVSPLHRPLFLRNPAYELLLKNGVKFNGVLSHVTEYGIDRIRYIPNEMQIVNHECAIDACIILHIDKTVSQISANHNLDSFVYNSYLHKTIEKNIKSSIRLYKIIPMYIMHYYGFSEIYDMLRSL